ncbi:LIM domain kinase 2-like isoform X3 [Halichondria panicea]|uniref:LIM domain kinase 2-like isoform X3 n=1 Tax=Halichondria panicea TaxID=6063 RepID=UPI00312BC9BE
MIQPMDRYNQPHPGMMTRPHNASPRNRVTEEFRKRVQQWNGGDNTLSTVRGNDHFGRPVGINSTATRNKTVLKSSPEQLAAASDRVEQEAGNTRPSMFGVALCYTVANAPPERSGVNSELAQGWKRRPRINQEKSQVISDKNENILDCVDTNTNIAPIQAADSEAPIIKPTDVNHKTSARRRPTPPPKPKKKISIKNSDQTVVKLQDAQVSHTKCLHDEGQMTIQVDTNTNTAIGPQVNIPTQAADTETPIVQPIDAKPKTSARRRPTPPPKPKKKSSMKNSDRTVVELHDSQVSLTDTKYLHDKGRMTIQEIVKPQAAVTTQAGVHEQPQPQQALLGEQQITNAGNEGFPTTRTRANPCDVAVEQSALTVQSTELEQLQAREAAHQQEVVKMKQEYKGELKTQLTDHNNTLAVLTSQLDAAKVENARLLTSADQTRLDHQRQLVELQHGLNRKVKADENASLQHQKEVEQRANQQFEDIFQHYENEIQRLTTKNEQLEAKSNYKDELAPYILPYLPELGEQQGSGSYGSVYPIQLYGICCIAKRIHDILLGQGREEGVNLEDKRAAYCKFYHECVLLSRIRHPNIVQFMGVYYGPQRDYGRELTLVMERMYTNLEDCLKQYSNIEMWLKVSILLDISQGLLYLHSRGVVHRDLTAANILLTTSFHAKIADLGVSRIINVHHQQSMIPGALGYMPPEALTEIPKYGSALDVFSFGVLILFVVLQKFPQYYDDLVTPEGLIHKESHIQKRSKWINMLPSDHPFVQLICDCLQDVPERRPTTNNLNYMLIQIAAMHPKPYQDIIDMQKR